MNKVEHRAVTQSSRRTQRTRGNAEAVMEAKDIVGERGPTDQQPLSSSSICQATKAGVPESGQHLHSCSRLVFVLLGYHYQATKTVLALCDKNLFLTVLESRKFNIKALAELAFFEGSLASKTGLCCVLFQG